MCCKQYILYVAIVDFCYRDDYSVRYCNSDIKQAVSRNYAITNSTNVKPSDPVYEAIIVTDHKPDCDVKMDANPAYQATS